MRALHRLAAVSLVLALAAPRPALADPHNPHDPEARRAFLEERLAAGTFDSNLWWYTWLGLTSAYWGLNVGLAATTDDRDQRVRTTASAIKTTLTIASIAFLPNPARTAEARLSAMDDSTPAARAARLAEAEHLLRYSAERSRKKIGWLSHVLNATINGLTAGVLIYGFDQEPTPVLLSAVLGFGAMEISYWTYPQRPRDDLADYERSFPTKP